MKQLEENLERLEVLSEIYEDVKIRNYDSKESRDVALLKAELLKKEMILLTYLISKELS